MCGIGGIVSLDGLKTGERETVLRRMAARLTHRGPDDEGFFSDATLGVGLLHRRLSIIDLSPLGHQPMASPSGRYVIVFNGEIYNHAAVRAELGAAGFAFRGGSDTETMLAAFEHWGFENALARLAGMFALAVIDRSTHELILARDRIGEKPLYYGWLGRSFAFASELKALEVIPDSQPSIDHAALAAYFQCGFVPAPHTVYADVRKLEPGCFLRLSIPAAERRWPEAQRYWGPADLQRIAEKEQRPYAEALARLEETLLGVVGEQMVSDRPMGAFLSGGIDSSLVVALMRRIASGPVKTFTIGFGSAQFDESNHARAVAAALGTEHHESRLDAAEMLRIARAVGETYDEPFADSSQIPTMLLAEETRRHVVVALSGDGGDESFGGYGRYHELVPGWNSICRWPKATRRSAARSLELLDSAVVESLVGPLYRLLGGRHGGREIRPIFRRMAQRLSHASFEDYYHDAISIWRSPVALPRVRLAPDPHRNAGHAGAVSLRVPMLLDTGSYLPDDIMVKVDRATMRVGLEGRAPLLDYRVVEAAWRFPEPSLSAAGVGKQPLRAILSKYLSPSLYERPKQGFAVPIVDWLRGPLQAWAAERIFDSRLAERFTLDGGAISRSWKQHQAGAWDNSSQLWTVLCLAMWDEARCQRAAAARSREEPSVLA